MTDGEIASDRKDIRDPRQLAHAHLVFAVGPADDRGDRTDGRFSGAPSDQPQRRRGREGLTGPTLAHMWTGVVL
jgi:hypothetical protein